MEQPIEVQALETISTEVDESQIKVILSTQCIKAQAYLVAKLRKDASNRKEKCCFLSSANFKLQAEITQAQAEIKSLLVAQETIRMANVDLKKEWLLAKDNKTEVMERVKNGEKKYEELWLESKARYESLPFVQKLLKAKDDVKNLEQQVFDLENDEKTLIEEIETKTETCRKLEKQRIIELAEFIVHEMPMSINLINEKSAAIKRLTSELTNLELKTQPEVETKESTQPKQNEVDLKIGKDWPLAEIIDMSQLKQRDNLDFDGLNEKLDQIKIKRVDSFNNAPEEVHFNSPRGDIVKVNRNIEHTEEYISSFFNKPSGIYEEIKAQNYAKMKLINILEDKKIHINEALDMIAKVNPDGLHQVDSICREDIISDDTSEVLKNKNEKQLESEEITEINLISSEINVISPPTQFVDMTLEKQGSETLQPEGAINQPLTSKEKSNLSQENKSSQEEQGKKRVSFDLPDTLETNDSDKPGVTDANDANPTLTTQLDVSIVSDEGFTKMKDMIIKKHNLNLSPQFVYAKNTQQKLLNSEDAVVTSKFFQYKQKNLIEKEIVENAAIETAIQINEIPPNTNEIQNKLLSHSKIYETPSLEMDIDTDIVSSPKRQKQNESTQANKPISGFLFNDGVQMISESLDGSINTTGFEDGDADFPHCIDSSLLLSPKADLPMSMSGENLSPDVPNFLSGLRKTGLSIFGHFPSAEPKPESSAQNQNQGGSGFSFNFGGEEKKSRGLFSMFQ